MQVYYVHTVFMALLPLPVTISKFRKKLTGREMTENSPANAKSI